MLEAPSQTFLDEYEEKGEIEESALEAFALEHDLEEEDLGALRAELEAQDVEIHPADDNEAASSPPTSGRPMLSSGRAMR